MSSVVVEDFDVIHNVSREYFQRSCQEKKILHI